jgi:orotidine-5'-phosphate decarboxylase
MSSKLSPIILALDTDDISTAQRWIEITADSIDIYKVGLEFFLKHGAEGLSKLRVVRDFQLFLDLKLHDIPNTVSGAVESVRDLHPKFLTVHAAGGFAMIQAAAQSAPDISITAVTVLTSLDSKELQTMGVPLSPLDYAVSLAKNAVLAGARSIVCSPLEVAAIRSKVGTEIELITPGVRPADAELGDQSRVMTPQEALASGANFLVIGRPITSYFKSSEEAMRDRAKEIRESLT